MSLNTVVRSTCIHTNMRHRVCFSWLVREEGASIIWGEQAIQRRQKSWLPGWVKWTVQSTPGGADDTQAAEMLRFNFKHDTWDTV